MSRYSKVFSGLKSRGEGAFVAFTVLGDPDMETSAQALDVLAAHADVLELGLPFSDPIADGKRIQAADERALRAGMTVEKCFSLVKGVRAKNAGIPIGLLVYYNLVYSNGAGKFLERAKDAGVDSVLVADMPIDEAAEFNKMCAKHGIEQVFIIAPTTGDARMKRILSKARGFAYAVGVLGVTGERGSVQASTIELVKRIRKQGKKIPVCVGFGVSMPAHARELVSAGADGVIVGSAIEAVIEENLKDRNLMLERLARFCAEMRAAARGHD